MSLTIRVLSDDGWQNGDKLYPKDKVFTLNHTQKEIQPYIDDGILEVVVPEVVEEPEDENKKRQDDIEAVTKAVIKVMQDFIPTGPKFEVKELVEDDPKGGFTSFVDFAHKTWLVGNDRGGNTPAHKQMREWEKMTESKAEKTTGHMAEADPEQGGYLVPTEFSRTLLEYSLAESVIRPRATFVPMQTNAIAIPGVTD